MERGERNGYPCRCRHRGRWRNSGEPSGRDNRSDPDIDAFEVIPLGVDPTSEQIGYPLLSFCMNGEELYNVAWVNALAPFVNDTDLWLSWSGAGFEYVDYLPPLSMWQCLDAEDPTCRNQGAHSEDHGCPYRVAVNSYVASNVGRLEDLSYGLIKVFPRDCSTGAPLASLDDAVVYEGEGDPLMEWEGFFEYLAQLPDTDGDGIPNIPARYAGPEGRFVKACVVATAAYGSPFDEKVNLLRDFRDRILMKSQAGKKFVSFYYAHGAPCGGGHCPVRVAQGHGSRPAASPGRRGQAAAVACLRALEETYSKAYPCERPGGRVLTRPPFFRGAGARARCISNRRLPPVPGGRGTRCRNMEPKETETE